MNKLPKNGTKNQWNYEENIKFKIFEKMQKKCKTGKKKKVNHEEKKTAPKDKKKC